MRMQTLMALISGLNIPTKGVVLVPPHVRVMVVLRDTGIIERGSVLDNLIFACGAEVQGRYRAECEDEVDGRLIEDLSRLCLKLGMSESLFGAQALMAATPMQQALCFASSQDRELISFVRALLPLPDVLLIEDLGNLDEAHAHALHSVLERHASGHDLAGILAEDEPPPKSAAHRRTIVWSALPEILSACGIEQHIHLSEDCGLSVSGRSRLPAE